MIHKTSIRIVTLILICVLLFNFTFTEQVNAEALTLGVASKVIITVLASMGILNEVKNNGGLDNFISRFLDTNDKIVEVYNLFQDSILNNTKMRISNLVNDLKDFFNNVWGKEKYSTREFMSIEDNIYYVGGGTFEKVSWATGSSGLTFHSPKYALNTRVEYQVIVTKLSYQSTPQVKISFFSNGSLSRTDTIGNFNNNVNTSDRDLVVTTQLQVGDSTSVLNLHYSSNSASFNERIPFTMSSLYWLPYENILPAQEVEYQIPPTQPAPLVLPAPVIDMPGLSVSGYVGKTIEDVLNDYGSISNDTFALELEKYTKAEIDSLEQPYIKWKEQVNVDTGAVETVVESIEGSKVNEQDLSDSETKGIIGNISNTLTDIKQTLSDIFSIPDDLTLDFDKLKLTNFQNKFPFSIPWDLARSINIFSSNPVEPNLDIDIDTNFLKVAHTIDVSKIELPLKFARYSVTVFFVLFLVNKTRDLIKW